MRTRRLASLLVLCPLFACSKLTADDGKSPDAGIGAGVGWPCEKLGDCRSGLYCDSVSKTCVPGGTVIQGGSCLLSAECTQGNYCTQSGACAASGTLPAGATCSGEGDCASGLLCAQTGLTGICQASGSGDVGRGCLETSECMAGLLCVRGQCNKGYLAAQPPVACSTVEGLQPVVYFHVPRATDSAFNLDFYRLPFPNDIRLKGGKVDLTGHPTPGATLLPFDLVQRYLGAIAAETTGFGANQAMYLRFSRAIDSANFPGDCAATLVDITPTSPDYGLNAGLTCSASNARASYICGPFMVVRPYAGSPLRPGTTYALLVTKRILDTLGNVFGPDDDFTAMLAAAPPADAELAAAWLAYQPLRDYIAAGHASAADLATALVFTVQPYEDPIDGVAAGVAAAPAPQIETVVRCDDPAAISPCDDGKLGAEHVRGCLAADASSTAFTTFQGTMRLPVFQAGTPPYATPAEGGGIVYDATGAAMLQRTESVCFSLTVPKGVAPASGWPLVVYAHGTGGSYRSIVDLGLAADFATGIAPAGLGAGVDGGASSTPVPMAVLGFDGVQHGSRGGGSTKPVGELVYNFLNPQAARDNALQAAADLLAIPRALPSFAAAGLVLDGNRIELYGHSQGGNAASLVAARPSPYGTIVMSGTGGTLLYTLLGKKKPVDVSAVLPLALGETGSGVDGNHPVLNLMQMYFEASDSVNFARRLLKEPPTGMAPHHILHVYGTGDTYSVPATQQTYALAAGLKVAAPVLDSYGLLVDQTGPPFSNNAFFGPVGKLTAIQLQYAPTAAYDGHFVSTENPAARAAIQQMLVTAARDGIPTVSP
jgi:hypothetical protein